MNNEFDLKLSPAVMKRLDRILQHIEAMEYERRGWGAQHEVDETRKSFVRALSTLFAAKELWPDGFEEDALSLGGVMPGGIVFGVIGRYGPSTFEYKPVEWTFHS